VSLFKIQTVVQEVAESISSILGVEVTIVDEKCKRVAATGKSKGHIGERIPQSCIFETVLQDREPRFVNQEERAIYCKDCEGRRDCAVLATIGHPIMNGEKVIGVIGVNAFREEEERKLANNRESLLLFLNKQSGLLVNTLTSYETIQALKIQSQEINQMIDGFRHGVICVDLDGMIKYINKSAETMLNVSGKDVINRKVDEFIPETSNPVMLKNHNKLKHQSGGISCLVKRHDVSLQDIKVSTIIELHRTSEMIKDAYNLLERRQAFTFDDIISRSECMEQVKEISKKVSGNNSTILIRGESGTGKELFARAIHFESSRSQAPFIAINCASIPENLLESELFGFERGSFTGARPQGHIGKFELANGGTLFLDEIGDLPIHLQPKLLRVLQENSFTRIGGNDLIEVDVRLIAATNRNLEKMIEDGLFREDLYYRLNVIPVLLPPLRARTEDIPLLSGYLLEKYCTKLGAGKKVFSAEVQKIFNAYRWPGNVREMENLVEYLVNISRDEVISIHHLPEAVRGQDRGKPTSSELDLKSRTEQFEAQVIESMIREYGDSTEAKQRIASILGINLTTLYRKMKKEDLAKMQKSNLQI
jgi:transcriptional regulator with PAS, ATPase and Fis domain